jgi:uncharacterized membrane protein (DUF4010 family)
MTPPNLDPLELAGRLALIAALAVFIGLSFEEVYKRDQRKSPGGVRTFPLLAICGAMLYLIEPQYALAFVAGLIVIGIWLHAFIRIESENGGPATLVISASNLVAYLMGPIGLTQPPWLVVAISVAAVLLLGTREQLHGLARLVPQDEILTAGKFLLLIGVILPLAPNEPVTTLTPLTPYKVWLAVIAICTLSYAGYVVQKFVPSQNSTLLPAILGGLYSSTATTIVLARRQREAPAARFDLDAGIIAATSIMYLRLAAVVAIFNTQMALELAPALIGLFAVSAAIAVHQWRKATEAAASRNLSIPANNPLQIPTAVVFATLFVVVSVLSAWAQATFGQQGVFALAAIVGLTDIDPFVINIAQGGVAGTSIASLSAAILIAASSNNIIKAAYGFGFGGFDAGRRPAMLLLLLAALGFVAAAILMSRG